MTYGATGQLATLGHDLSGTSADVSTSFTFNPAGQLASETRDNDAYAFGGLVNVDRAYTNNGLNQHTAAGAVSFTYDANGNLTGDGTTTYTYDIENRLVAVSGGGFGAVLRYDPLGRLYELTDTGTGGSTIRMLYDRSDLVGEYTTSGTLLRRYAHGPGAGDDPIAWYEGSAVNSTTRRFLMADRLGSIISVADYSGGNLVINAYDEFGIPDAGNLGRFQYTGQAWLEEAGLYYYKARMYSPSLGRFMQRDPIGYADSMNWYNYVGSDPMNFVDPTGKEAWDLNDPCFDCDGWGLDDVAAIVVTGYRNWMDDLRFRRLQRIEDAVAEFFSDADSSCQKALGEAGQIEFGFINATLIAGVGGKLKRAGSGIIQQGQRVSFWSSLAESDMT